MDMDHTAAMADDEEDEEDEEMDTGLDGPAQAGSKSAAGSTAERISTGVADAATREHTEASRRAYQEQQKQLQAAEMRRAVAATVVPTDDAKVRQMLRQFGEPITLFGEKEMERRDRLRKLMAAKQAAGESVLPAPGTMEVEEVVVVAREKFYTEGSDALRRCRMDMLLWSLSRSCARLNAAKRKRSDPDENELQERTEALKVATTVKNEVSEVGDARPIQACEISPDGSQLATGAWSGRLKLWSLPRCAACATIVAHGEVGNEWRITGLTWHPHASPSHPHVGDTLQLATASSDMTAKLWTAQGKSLRTLAGHTERLARLAFHPMARHLATASFDGTWRLWDLETGDCLAEQEGHSRAVYCVAFHDDGSLAASGGLDAIARIWDCRSGRNVVTLQGHVRSVLSVDFARNGYMVATGSEDNSCKVWDLRKRDCVYTIPGHTKLISRVQFDPIDGHYLMTASYDHTIRLWSSLDWKLQRTLIGHEEKVMDANIATDGSGFIASVSYDRIVKLWAPSPDFDDAEMDIVKGEGG